MNHLPLLVSSPAKEGWFWETAAIAAAALLLLNLVLMVIVYGRRGYEVVRARRARAFRARFARLVDEIAAARLTDPEEAYRQVASLDALERPIAASMLLERLRPASTEQRAMIVGLVRELGGVGLMLEGTTRRRPWRRALSLRTLGWLGAQEGVPAALERLGDRNRYVRDASVRALGRIADERALLDLERLFLDPNRDVSSGFAYEAVVAFGASAEPVFRQGLRSDDEHVRVASCFGIASTIEPERARPLLEQMLDDGSPGVRAAALEMLARIGGEQAPAEMARASRAYEPSVRRAAAGALGAYDDSLALELLRGALLDPDRLTVVRAGESLFRLSRLPRVGANARDAIGTSEAWAVQQAATLAALGAL